MGIWVSGSLDSFLRLLGTLIIFIFVLVVTYLVTRWMGVYQKGRFHNKNLRVVETIGVGNNKLISIVEAGKKYLVVSVGKDEVHLLAELTREDFKDLTDIEESAPGASGEHFSDVLGRLKDKLPQKRD